MILNSFFPLKICLNHPSATERWGYCLREFERVGLKGVARFQALPDIGPHQSFNRSVHEILSYFVRSPYDRLLFMEDDIVFTRVDGLETALKELPAGWDAVYLGANVLHPDPKPEPYSPHLCRLQSAWTSHAVGFTKKIAKFVIENQPGYSEMMFDNWLSGNLSRFNSYIVVPMAAYQRPGNSLIWGTSTNYDTIFTGSDLILNHICKRR